MDELTTFWDTQVWSLPYLALYGAAVVYALTRRDMGKASRYAAWGFGLFVLDLVLSAVDTYIMINRDPSDVDMLSLAWDQVLFSAASLVLNIGGWIFILLAIFAKRTSPSRVE